MSTRPNIKLRDCPFCGSPANLAKTLLGDAYTVDCSGTLCSVAPMTNPERTPEDAATAWNGSRDATQSDLLFALLTLRDRLTDLANRCHNAQSPIVPGDVRAIGLELVDIWQAANASEIIAHAEGDHGAPQATAGGTHE